VVTADTLHVPDAEVAEAIIAAAKGRNCALIVMASHGRRGLGRLMLGSKAYEVLTHSDIPVLIVR
jgi:nucleotide-binding universal stress UspA family protein